MQTIYAMRLSGSDNLQKEEKFLLASIDAMMDLYLIMLSALVELQKKELNFIAISKKKHLASKVEKNPNLKFVQNKILVSLVNNQRLNSTLDIKKINNWKNNDDTILLLLQDIKSSAVYKEYMSSTQNDFEHDKKFLIDLYTDVIAPNDNLYTYLEDYKLTWADDFPAINTQIIKELKLFNEEDGFRLSKLYKDQEDEEFVINLLRKTSLNEEKLTKEYENKTPNWDIDRIAEIDRIMLRMAICEFLYFPSIPVKVSLNEYLEVAKEYSTPNSSIFINGILDNLVKEFQKGNRILKSGRGLI